MFINLENVCRTFSPESSEKVDALRDVSIELALGEFAAVTGESGCGKSTLLHLLAALDAPTSGEIYVDGKALHAMNETERTRYRRIDVGIVFQFFNLLPTMTVTENVALPLLLQGTKKKVADAAAEKSLDLVGIRHRARHFPRQLSGGEMQRTAVARALVHEPSLLLADEPTGNLDRRNAENVLELLRQLHADQVTTLIVVTHSDEVAAAAQTRIHMEDGRVVD